MFRISFIQSLCYKRDSRWRWIGINVFTLPIKSFVLQIFFGSEKEAYNSALPYPRGVNVENRGNLGEIKRNLGNWEKLREIGETSYLSSKSTNFNFEKKGQFCLPLPKESQPDTETTVHLIRKTYSVERLCYSLSPFQINFSPIRSKGDCKHKKNNQIQFASNTVFLLKCILKLSVGEVATRWKTFPYKIAFFDDLSYLICSFFFFFFFHQFI